MSLSLPPDVLALVQKHLGLGSYKSEADVIRSALFALDRQQAVLDDIKTGIADMESGKVRSLEEVDGDLRSKHSIPRQ